MGFSRQLAAIDHGFQIVASFPENGRHTPIVLGESDPEGCAACSAQENPQNAYRNGAAITLPIRRRRCTSIYELANREHVNFLGEVNWSFEFEDQSYFAGFREMASNGLDKPVLNAFRMFGMLGRNECKVTNSGALSMDEVVHDGVRGQTGHRCDRYAQGPTRSRS